MRRKVFAIVAKVLAFVSVAGAALLLYASYEADRARDLPYPVLSAARDEASLVRGATIFHATCEACHRAPGSARAAGAPISDAPEWIGHLHSGNLTRHPVAGIARLPDRSLARTIRYGVNRDGRWIPMPAYALSDSDLAAVLGFLRSSDPLFLPVAQKAPHSELSLLGKLALFLGGTFAAPEVDRQSVSAVPRAPSVEYGRYLAESVYQCGDCHTPGFDRDKTRGPEAYSGGAEMKTTGGQTIYSRNLTMDEATGIGTWTRDDFGRAVRQGIRPDGARLRPPMPAFRGADDVEIAALFAYLRSLPEKRREVPRPGVVRAAAR